ncbi:glycosyl transferase family 90-domain-containing protein [Obelidium mucronatum]|nr:glycosyl transferase family 90-domain-containing protein [Obelidium mucronatum]
MNAWNREPPPNFDKWVDFALSQKCSINATDYRQIYRDLSPWIKAGCISSNSVLEWKNSYEGPDKLVDFVTFDSSSFSKTSAAQQTVLKSVSHLLPQKKFHLIISRTDYPSVVQPLAENETLTSCLSRAEPESVRSSHGFFLKPKRSFQISSLHSQNLPIPVFSRAKPKSGACYKDLMFPTSFHVEQIKHVRDTISWSKKKPVLFFRGGPTSGLFDSTDTNETWRKFHRIRLMDWEKLFAQRNPELVFDAGRNQTPSSFLVPTSKIYVDVGFHTGIKSTNTSFKKRFAKEYRKKSRVGFQDMLQFKYLLVVDGYTWPSRLQYYLETNSVVLYAGIFIDYFMWRLEPWVHYIPVKTDFSDLDKKLEWLLHNDEQAHNISRNAKSLVRSLNNLGAMQCYAGLMLLEYSRLYTV